MSDVFVVAWLDLDDSGAPIVTRRTYDRTGKLISISAPVPLPVFIRPDSAPDNPPQSE